jgi:hypothetical protein
MARAGLSLQALYFACHAELAETRSGLYALSLALAPYAQHSALHFLRSIHKLTKTLILMHFSSLSLQNARNQCPNAIAIGRNVIIHHPNDLINGRNVMW